MEFKKESRFYDNIQGLESVVVEEYSNIEILISCQNEESSSENLFLKGDVILNNDRIVFKGLYRMEYFTFFIKIYNLLSITRNSDYIVFSISDLANVIQNHLINHHKLFDSLASGRSLEIELNKTLQSHLKKKDEKFKFKKIKWTDQFKAGKEFELIGDFQIRVIMRNRVKYPLTNRLNNPK
jgi:hypothetical protein